MMKQLSTVPKRLMHLGLALSALLLGGSAVVPALFAQEPQGGEANLVLPDLGSVAFLGGISGHAPC